MSGNSDLSGFRTSAWAVDDNVIGLQVQLGGSVQSTNLSAEANTYGIVLLVDAIVSSPVEVRGTRNVGVFVGDGSFGSFSGSVEDSGALGIWTEHDATLTFSGNVGGQPIGMLLDGVEARITNTTVTDPVELIFGTRVDFAGGNSFTGGVSCDGTVLVRGDVACPPPAIGTAPARGARGALQVEAPRALVTLVP